MDAPYWDIFLLIVGIFLGWLVTYLDNRTREKRENEERYEQIKKQFEFNLDHMHKLSTALVECEKSPLQKEFPDYTLDVTVLDFLLAQGPKSFPQSNCGCTSAEQFRRFNWHRYQMHHLNNRLRILLEIYATDDGQRYIKSVISHLNGEVDAINRLLLATP